MGRNSKTARMANLVVMMPKGSDSTPTDNILHHKSQKWTLKSHVLIRGIIMEHFVHIFGPLIVLSDRDIGSYKPCKSMENDMAH